jgi:hypothetical protein
MNFFILILNLIICNTTDQAKLTHDKKNKILHSGMPVNESKNIFFFSFWSVRKAHKFKMSIPIFKNKTDE